MKTSFVAVVLALFLMAGGIFAFKVRWMNYPVLPPPEAPLWVVKAEIGFDTAAAPVTLRLAVPPKQQPGLRVTDQGDPRAGLLRRGANLAVRQSPDRVERPGLGFRNDDN